MFPNCKQVARWQSDAQERKLPWHQRLGMKLHLLVCKWCRRYERQLNQLRGLSKDFADKEAAKETQKLPDEARSRIKQMMRDQEK